MMNRLLIAGLALAGLVSAAVAQNTPGTPLGTVGGTAQGTGGVTGGTTGTGAVTGGVGGTGMVQIPGLFPGGIQGTTTGGVMYYPPGWQYPSGMVYGLPYSSGGVIQTGYPTGMPGGVIQTGYPVPMPGGMVNPGAAVYGTAVAGVGMPGYGGCGCAPMTYSAPMAYSVPVDNGCGKKRKRGLFR